MKKIIIVLLSIVALTVSITGCNTSHNSNVNFGNESICESANVTCWEDVY